MKVLRVYSGDDGESHFEDIEVPLKDLGHIGKLSKLENATGVVFRTTGGDYEYGWHCAPRRQYVINLDAAVELEVGDGSVRRLEAGSVLLAEDLTGRGHISRAVDGKPRTSMFVTLD
jgi:hypothetical protein